MDVFIVELLVVVYWLWIVMLIILVGYCSFCLSVLVWLVDGWD